jgi:hypothetical protein
MCEANAPAGCPVAGTIAPILPLPRSAGYRSVVGGVAVRDPGLPTLAGRYLFGDHFQPTLYSAATDGSALRREPDLGVTGATAVSEDGCGHVHVAAIGGPVYRIQDGALGACVVPPLPPPPPASPPGSTPPATTPPTAGDPRACGLRVRGHRRTQRILRRGKRLRLRLRAAEPCTATLRARRFRTKTVVVAADVARTVRLKATRAGLRKLRRQLKRSDERRLRVTVTISARDTAGHFGVRRVRPRVR